MKDRVVVITGASSGIGANLAEVVAKRGGKPVLVARREKELVEVATRCGGKDAALVVVADVTKRADVEAARDTAIKRFGHIDVWVNNAGRGISRNPSELTDQDIDDMMLVNVKSALYGMQAVLSHFKERKKGHIINVSSMLGRVPFAPIRSAYSASKHALNALTANMRMEVKATHPDIHVSSVHPGVVATDFGTNSMHGGMDSRKLPNAQPVEEVGNVIADLIENPRADIYTRPGAQQMIASYFSAEDMATAEAGFAHLPANAAATNARP
jgi:NADP-dependent 3-hydroxy acid dehydrogenase YdfG